MFTTVMPRRPFSWLAGMAMAAAETNPEMTGAEKKSIRKPSLRRAQAVMAAPLRKARRTA